MALIGWKELREQAELGNPGAIQALITTLEDLTTEVGPPDLENAEWELEITDISGAIRELQELRDRNREQIQKLTATNYQHQRDYESLRESITERLREAVNGEGLELELAKTIAADLGVNPPTNKYTVSVDVQIVVEGVEADDADAAESMVTENISIDDVSADGEEVSTEWNITNTEVTEE